MAHLSVVHFGEHVFLYREKANNSLNNNTGFDRDLGIAGRVMVRESNGSIVQRLIKIDRPSKCSRQLHSLFLLVLIRSYSSPNSYASHTS